MVKMLMWVVAGQVLTDLVKYIPFTICILGLVKPSPQSKKLHFSKNFERFVLQNIISWRTSIEDWVVLGNVTVIHFENVLTNKTREIIKVLKFLELNMDSDRLHCMAFYNFDMYQRKHQSLEKSPFTDKIRRIVNDSILSVDRILTQYGHAGIPFENYSIP